MKTLLRCLALPTGALLAACAASPPPSTPPSEETVAPAVRAALGGDWDARYFDATVDLNGDGRAEVIAYVAGPMVCGTGGCNVLVFTPGDGGYRLVGRISVARPPVRVSSVTTNGWRDLVVGIGGGGMPPGNAILKFDGASYPSNPTVPPAVTAPDLVGTELLIPEFESYTDGKPLPAGPSR